MATRVRALIQPMDRRPAGLLLSDPRVAADLVVPIYKEKGNIQDCGNYRGIKLMSHAMKIWERIIERRLREETTIGDEQFGFMPGRGRTDAIFAVRQLMEKYRGKTEKGQAYT